MSDMPVVPDRRNDPMRMVWGAPEPDGQQYGSTKYMGYRGGVEDEKGWGNIQPTDHGRYGFQAGYYNPSGRSYTDSSAGWTEQQGHFTTSTPNRSMMAAQALLNRMQRQGLEG